MGFLSNSSLVVLLYALVSTVSVFPAQKLLFQRESRSGNYGVSSWALSFQIIEVPREAIFVALYSLIAVSLSRMDGPLWQYLRCEFVRFPDNSPSAGSNQPVISDHSYPDGH